jgi:dTDP-glucose 4,6-dehydratase
MHALITGGCGFIGAHLVEHLLVNTDWQLTVLDGLTYAGDIARLTDITRFDPKRVRVMWHDLRAPIHDRLRTQIGDVDYILNLASESSVDRSIADPVPFVMNNVQLTLNMHEYARKVKPRLFLQISTDEVFGPAPDTYRYKEWDPHMPSNPYAASKSAQEAIAMSYFRTYDVPVIITNTMNNFGERQHPEKLIPLAIRNLLAKRPVPVHAELVNGIWHAGSRVWLHARNHADALLFILKNVGNTFYVQPGKPPRFNVAGRDELSNRDIVELVAASLDVLPLWQYVDFHTCRPGHDRRYALDGSKLALAGWEPPVDFQESLDRTVKWYLKNPHWLNG